MFTPMLVLLALVLVGGTAVFVAARHAPAGFEDEDGFHFDDESDRVEPQYEMGSFCWIADRVHIRGAGVMGPAKRIRQHNGGGALRGA
jgi:hypothetical protein